MQQYEVWVLPWVKWVGLEESSDGFSLHQEESHARYFAQNHRNALPAFQQEIYSLPKGDAYPTKVDEETYRQVVSGKFGIRCDQRKNNNGGLCWIRRI